MAHYAKVLNGVVVSVIVAEKDFIDTLPEKDFYVQTSYNTRANKYIDPSTNEEGGGTPLRGNFASIGATYLKEEDVFIGARPYDSWVLNHDTWTWEAPIPYPTDGSNYEWDEATRNWIELTT